MASLFETSSAVISPCGKYRYRLERDGPGEGRTVVIMVNPSTADAEQDDATIRKLKGFGARNGWGRIIVGNLFAYRATDVRELAATHDPIGPCNDEHLADMAAEATRVVFAWGPVTKQPTAVRHRWRAVDELFRTWMGMDPLSIGVPAKCGHPKHPLMLAYDSPILPWAFVRDLMCISDKPSASAIASGSREGRDSEAWRGAKQARAARSASPEHVPANSQGPDPSPNSSQDRV